MDIDENVLLYQDPEGKPITFIFYALKDVGNIYLSLTNTIN